jgi:hypothetical protein
MRLSAIGTKAARTRQVNLFPNADHLRRDLTTQLFQTDQSQRSSFNSLRHFHPIRFGFSAGLATTAIKLILYSKMISGKDSTENISLQQRVAGNPDEIWIFRDGAARADQFRLSRLPTEIENVANFIGHIKDQYKEDYSSIAADRIVIKDKVTGAVLDPWVKLSELAGNSGQQPYPVKVKGSSSSDIFSLIFKVINALCMSNNQKATMDGLFSGSFYFGSDSSSSSVVSAGQSKGRRRIVSSSAPLSSPWPQTYTGSKRLAKKSGSGKDGKELRRRFVAVSDEKDEMYTE